MNTLLVWVSLENSLKESEQKEKINLSNSSLDGDCHFPYNMELPFQNRLVYKMRQQLKKRLCPHIRSRTTLTGVSDCTAAAGVNLELDTCMRESALTF